MPTPTFVPAVVKCWDYPCEGHGTYIGQSPVGVHLYTDCSECGEDLSCLY